MDTDPAMLAREIEEFIKNQENDQNVLDPEHTASQARPEQQRTPQPPAKTHVKVNYNGRHIELDVSNATPSEIKEGFGISSGNLELNRRGQNYKETNDNTFDPPLTAGTYNITIIEVKTKKKESTVPKRSQVKKEPSKHEDENIVTFYCDIKEPVEVEIDTDGRVYFESIEFFKNKSTWTSIFIVNESEGTVTKVEEAAMDIPAKKGTKYGLLFNSKEENHQQLKSLHRKNAQISYETNIKSLSGVSMASAAVYWIVFSKTFLALSKINNELLLENDIKDFKFLICPRSLKNSLFQMAVSINGFVQLQIFNAVHIYRKKEMRDNHYSGSLTYLMKLKEEVNEFINALIGYLREKREEESTILLINKLKQMEHSDKRVENDMEEHKKTIEKLSKINTAENSDDDEDSTPEPEEYKAVIEKLSKINTATIFSSNEDSKSDLEKIVAQRKVLNSIFEHLDEMNSTVSFNITNILDILKLLKELICTEITQFIQADVIDKCPDPDEELNHIKPHYNNVYQMWRLIGTAFNLVINFDQPPNNWNLIKEEILKVQRMAEVSFHEIMDQEILTD
ncbi:hypothetical protein FO519_008243 [Halicephalobus sp. NKZ332]|nr:hypothetical protein FO519_008243 [Halicephalobus sp. NKZ332]